jgi:hypothetical protein
MSDRADGKGPAGVGLVIIDRPWRRCGKLGSWARCCARSWWGPLATDAAGNPAPFTSPAAYQRASVAVPSGNCTEPSNVKAGGGACPIRFQCADCGFYRPDPSYLPALEQHIASRH